MRCESCEVLVINGVLCHETGCPDAWRSEERECKECGQAFRPEHRGQNCCDDSCYCAYYAIETGRDGEMP